METDELEIASLELAEATRVFSEKHNKFNQLLSKWKKLNN